MNNFDLRKFLIENRDTNSTKLLSEVEFTKKEIINSVTFPTGDVYTVGEYSNYDGMRIATITPVPENEREADEVVAIEMRDGDNAVVYKFNAEGKEVEY